jgi:RNA ligase (TIGR02306 family)
MSKLIIEICRIEEVKTHPNADKLDIIKVKGWQCIVSRDTHKIGDLVIYCPPDSIIPNDLIEKYKLEFLKKNGRVGTIKLRGELSQGLILDIPGDCKKCEGMDVAEILGIIKYEPPEPKYTLSGQQQKKRKSNPLFDKYTDIENINNFNTVFEDGEEVVITEKIHGCNARYANLPVNTNVLWGFILKLFGKGYEFVYGSHEIQKKWSNTNRGFYKEDVWKKIAKRYKFNEWLPKDYIIYGEIYGKGIQELTYGLDDIEFRVFDIKYKGKYLDWRLVYDFCQVSCLMPVPELFIGKYDDETRKLLSVGNSILSGAEIQIREGCVIKPIKERDDHKLGRVILKSLNPEYLLMKNRTEHH